MKALATAVLATAMLTGPLAAECLDSADLTRGVTILYDNGDSTDVRRTSGGYQQVDETYADGSPAFRFRAHRGVYFVEEFEPDAFGRPVPGSGLLVEFEIDPALLPDPAAGVSWEGQSTNVFDDGTRRTEQMSIAFTQGAPLDLSGCRYETLETRLLYDWGADGSLELKYLYLPAVGTAVLTSSHFSGDSPFTYVPVGIERRRK